MDIIDVYKKRRILFYAKRTAAAALLLLCILFIWHNSMEEAGLSGARSIKITKAVNELLVGEGQTLISENSIRKLAHFSEYALEGILAVFFFGVYGLLAGRYVCAGILLGIFTALTDETIQLFSPGRDGAVADVWIDFGGFLCGALVSFLWVFFKTKIKEKKPE